MACCGQLQLLSAPPIVNRPSTRHRNPSPKISPVQFFPSSKISAVQSFPAFSSTSQNPKPFPSLESGRKKTLALALTSIFASASAGGLILSGGGGGGAFGGGGGGFGGGGGGGNGGGGFWSWLFPGLSANAKEEEKAEGSPEWDSHGLPANLIAGLRKLSGMKRYKISEILFFDRRRRSTAAGADDPFSGMVSLLPGGVYTKSQLQVELETLGSSGMFEKVDLEAKTKPDGTLGLTVSYTEATWPSADAFRCINVGSLPQMKQVEMDPDMTDREKFEYVRSQERDYRKRVQRTRACLLPVTVQREVRQMLREYGKVSAGLLQRIHDRVLKWYHDEGYACAKVVNFGNLTSREVVCEVVEGDITQLAIQFEDNLGNVVEGDTQLGIIRRELPYLLNKGHVFNIEAAKQGLGNLNSLSLFSNIEVSPRPDENNEGGIIVDIKLKEMKQKSTEVNTEWNIAPGQNGWPALGSIQPGGTVTYEHRNIKGLNRSLVASVNSSNLLNPQDDLSYKFEYVHPYLDGVHNPRNRTFRVSCFNSRKMSPVFTGGSGVDEVPPVWIDREGIKANITESLTSQSKLTYGLVMEEIKTRDETSSLCTHGARQLPTGALSMHGPPTTLSGTGVDRMAFAQANIIRDNTKFVNGATVGDRNVFQVDQGLGIGSKFPFFNRHQLSLTKFIQLKKVEEGAGKPPPPTLVFHGNYGGCVGDLPSYDAFTLGGPYSVRGYNMGELGACRNKLELAAELRVPVKNNIVYAFAEHGNDLGSSKDVKGNPTEFFQRVGHGSSYGVGTKFGPVRMEYVVDHNTGKGSVVLRFGERF